MTEEHITMSHKELDRLEIIQAVAGKQLKQLEAARQSGLSVRQIKRLVRRYRDEGAAGLVSRRRGRRANNALADGVRQAAMHRRGVLVQDLALRNLIRRPDSGLVFIDFGMAYVFPRRGLVFHILLGRELFKLLRDAFLMDEVRFAEFRKHYDAAMPDLGGWRRWVAEWCLAYWMRRHTWKARRQ